MRLKYPWYPEFKFYWAFVQKEIRIMLSNSIVLSIYFYVNALLYPELKSVLKSGILSEYINNIGILFTDFCMNNFFNWHNFVKN